jgi:hypothetical protein
MLYVDINLGQNNIERIVVFEGNTAEDLAKNFAKLHGKNRRYHNSLM